MNSTERIESAHKVFGKEVIKLNAVLELVDGHVSKSEMYSLAEIKRRLGLGPHALRTARRQGLRVVKIGRNEFVLGSDLMRYAVTMHGESQQMADES